MTDRPILFSGPMVRAILDGRKSQTRRVLKINGARPDFCGGHNDGNDPTCWGWEDPEHGDWVTLEKEPGQRMGWRDWRGAYAPGDRLWVREAWQAHSWETDCVTIRYRAEERTAGFTAQIEQIPYPAGDKDALKYVAPQGPHKWRPSIHMPRWASRLTLTVSDVRVQRLQEISAEDARDEGVNRHSKKVRQMDLFGADAAKRDAIYLQACRWEFRDLWDSLNAKRGYGWDANPWVVAISFDVHRGNIDQVPA